MRRQMSLSEFDGQPNEPWKVDMAYLRSRDGKIYNVPDDELEKFEIPAERLKQVLSELDAAEGQGDVQPYGWRDCAPHRWRNHWRNCWRNCY